MSDLSGVELLVQCKFIHAVIFLFVDSFDVSCLILEQKMGNLETFQIIFTHPQGVFFAGQAVRGNVHVVLGEPMKMRGR